MPIYSFSFISAPIFDIDHCNSVVDFPWESMDNHDHETGIRAKKQKGQNIVGKKKKLLETSDWFPFPLKVICVEIEYKLHRGECHKNLSKIIKTFIQ